MNESDSLDGLWVVGDGGPLVLLQAGVIPTWTGAANFENSLERVMNFS